MFQCRAYRVGELQRTSIVLRTFCKPHPCVIGCFPIILLDSSQPVRALASRRDGKVAWPEESRISMIGFAWSLSLVPCTTVKAVGFSWKMVRVLRILGLVCGWFVAPALCVPSRSSSQTVRVSAGLIMGGVALEFQPGDCGFLVQMIVH